jgi:hypothetical protein
MNNLVVTKAAIELQRLAFRRRVAGVFGRHGFWVTSVDTFLLAIRDDVSAPS